MAERKKNEMLQIIEHPLVQHKLTLLRDNDTGTPQFRQLLKEIGQLMGYEVTRGVPARPKRVYTPLGPCDGTEVIEDNLVVVPILRAGLGMADGLLELLPGARVGHIGCYRDYETKRPVEYLVKLPDPTGRTFFVVDPMLATGLSAAHAVTVLKERGVAGSDIWFMALVAAPEGVSEFHEAHPDVHVLVAGLDSHLDASAYIVPGLGDAGDRLYGTIVNDE
ncbi:MAG: uracil phosphoribosyltransferase [Alphaproteobacteria bacterium]